jgi:hypothetical protein
MCTSIAIVINNKKFTCGMKDRVGTDVDAEMLVRLFVHLGFHTNRYDNLKGRDFKKRLQVRHLLSTITTYHRVLNA